MFDPRYPYLLDARMETPSHDQLVSFTFYLDGVATSYPELQCLMADALDHAGIPHRELS